MITSDLILYIQKQIKKNISKDLIISRLKEVGWEDSDISEAFSKATPVVIEPSPIIKEEVKSQEESSESKIENKEEVSKKIWMPKVAPILNEISPSVNDLNSVSALKTEETSVVKSTDVPKINITPPQTEKPKEDILPKVETSNANVDTVIGESKQPEKKEEDSKEETLAKKAMISSYAMDFMSANKMTNEPSGKKKISTEKLMIILLIVLVVGGLAFMFIKGVIKVPSISGILVKHDPKEILLNNSDTLESTDNYKSEMEIKINSPLPGNIWASFMELKPIEDGVSKDNITIRLSGGKSKISSLAFASDYSLNIKSSLLDTPIASNYKYNGDTTYIKVPDLSSVLGSDAPYSGVLALPSGALGSLSALLPDNIKTKIEKADVYKILTDGVPFYVSNEIKTDFKDFIANTTYEEVGSEYIYGVDTIHYKILIGKDNLKKFLNQVFDIFVINLPVDQRSRISNGLSQVSMDAIDVWIGKSDNRVYQYNFVATIPFSKILGFDDVALANSDITLDWRNTYYDFGTGNNIIMPSDFTTVEEFISKTKDLKVKNLVSILASSINDFGTKAVSFGKIPNSGNCASPVKGSLFSTLGHTASMQESSDKIGSSLKELMDITSNKGACYSNSGAWSVSAPLPSSNISFYCLDNTGEAITSDTLAKGVSCK